MGGCTSGGNFKKVVVLGHPNAGKTTLLRQLTKAEPEQQVMQPYALLRFHDLTFYELNSQPEQRARWIHQCQAARGILYVASQHNLAEELSDLIQLLQPENLATCPLFVAVTHSSQRPQDSALRKVQDTFKCSVGYFDVSEGALRGSFRDLKYWLECLA